SSWPASEGALREGLLRVAGVPKAHAALEEDAMRLRVPAPSELHAGHEGAEERLDPPCPVIETCVPEVGLGPAQDAGRSAAVRAGGPSGAGPGHRSLHARSLLASET